MPTYDYECNSCGHKFETFQSMTEKPLRKCPECGKLKLERLIGMGAGILFKGSGFYQTDYRSSDYKKAAKADSASSKSSSDSSKSKSKSDSKPKETTTAKSSD